MSTPEKEENMKYMLLINTVKGLLKWDQLSEDQQNAVMAEYYAISEFARSRGRRAAAADRHGHHRARPKRPDADDRRAVSRDEGDARRLLPVRGPTAHDAAIELAARIPAARFGGSVEVRPLAEM